MIAGKVEKVRSAVRFDRRSCVPRTLVVVAHPVPESLIRSALARVLAGLETAGAEVRVLDLDAENFNPVLSLEEKLAHIEAGPERRPELAEHFDALLWAERLVLVHPTWFGDQPARLKGWFDRVWMNDVAFTLPEGATRLHGGLRNIRAIDVVTTHGSSKVLNALQGNPGRLRVFRTMRVLCHPLTRTRWIALYSLDKKTRDDIVGWLDDVEAAFSS